MKDCSLTVSVRNNKVTVENRDVGLVELVEMSGILQIMSGKVALKRGIDIEDIKDNMLDTYLNAMRQVEQYAPGEWEECRDDF